MSSIKTNQPGCLNLLGLLRNLLNQIVSLLERLWNWLKRIWEPEVKTNDPGFGTASVSEPPKSFSPDDYGLGTFFRSDPKAIEESRQALIDYRKQYPNDPRYPLRVIEMRHTGLPAILTGFRPGGAPALSPAFSDAWLFKDPKLGDMRSKVLFGLAGDEANRRIHYVDRSEIQLNKDAPVHVRYQQLHDNNFPVFGGGVVVHYSPALGYVSATSSYLPIAGNAVNTNAAFLPEEACDKAVESLIEFMLEKKPQTNATDVAGLYIRAIRRWQDRQGDARKPAWSELYKRAAQNALSLLIELNNKQDHNFNWLDELARGGIPSDQDSLMNRIGHAVEWQSSLGVSDWTVNVVPYHDKELFVLPFIESENESISGKYHLAYQVHCVSRLGNQAWRVFIDAQTGKPLGEPYSMIMHATYYPTSSAAGSGIPVQLPANTNLAVPDDIFQFQYHPDCGSSADVNRDPDAALNPGAVSKLRDATLDAINVMFHARAIFDHFKPFSQSILNAPRIPVLIGKKGDSGDVLNMGFSYGSAEITFQNDSTGNLGLLSIDGRRVFVPSLDPEVIYHEVVHAFMWLLNKTVFEDQNAQVPFSTALLEGYANFFARSFAAINPPALTNWASGAYRANDWSNEWALPGVEWHDGRDYLAAPNLYTHEDVGGLAPYDVGMVWARALWDIRPSIPGNVSLDELALNAFLYALGWITNFEIVAEGLADSVRQSTKILAGTKLNVVQTISEAFARRGILAERGIQTLTGAKTAQGTPVVFVGSDAGVWRWDSQTGNWNAWGNPGGKGAIALSAEGTMIYAASEEDVFQRDLNAQAWTKIGNWATDTQSQRPTCLLAINNRQYVGTGLGVWLFDPANLAGTWKPWDANTKRLFLRLTDKVSSGIFNQSHRVYGSVYNGVLALNEASTQGWNGTGNWDGLATLPRVTALTARGSIVYAGTLRDGIWQQTNAPWTRVIQASAIKNSAVLCLAVDGNILWAGTTAGLYKVDNGNATLAPIPTGANNSPIVTCVLAFAGFVFAGTAADGLWVGQGGAIFQRANSVGV